MRYCLHRKLFHRLYMQCIIIELPSFCSPVPFPSDYNFFQSNLLWVRSRKIQSRVFTFYSMWGLAAIYLYRSYPSPSFLMDAISFWEQATMWAIEEEDATKGQFSNLTFPGTCNGCKSSTSVYDSYFHNCDSVSGRWYLGSDYHSYTCRE